MTSIEVCLEKVYLLTMIMVCYLRFIKLENIFVKIKIFAMIKQSFKKQTT